MKSTSVSAAMAAFMISAFLIKAVVSRQLDGELPFLSFINEFRKTNMPLFNRGDQKVESSIGKIDPVFSTSTGYFYAQYYTQSNCSSGTGSISYVEGYSTGSCLSKVDPASGLSSGSMIHVCAGKGQTLLVQAYDSTDCSGAPVTTSNYSMNVCAASTSKYGISVDVKCSSESTNLPLLQDAIVASSFGNSDAHCSGHPIVFKAFSKSACANNQFSGATEYFTCPDKVSNYQLSGGFDGACSIPVSYINSTSLSSTCSVTSTTTKVTSIPSAGLYDVLQGRGPACSARCSTIQSKCAPTARPTGSPSLPPKFSQSLRRRSLVTTADSSPLDVLVVTGDLPTDQPSSSDFISTSQPTTLTSFQPTSQQSPTSESTSSPSLKTGQPTSAISNKPSVSIESDTSQPTLPTFQPSLNLAARERTSPEDSYQPSTNRPSTPTALISEHPSFPSAQPSTQTIQITDQPTTYTQTDDVTADKSTTSQPSLMPSSTPTSSTAQPTSLITTQPSLETPVSEPTSAQPTSSITTQPSLETPVSEPTSAQPTSSITTQPSLETPVSEPTSAQPTSSITTQPSLETPVSEPTSAQPTSSITTQPSLETPVSEPTSAPSVSTTAPTSMITNVPSTIMPSYTMSPTSGKTTQPTSKPSSHATLSPSVQATVKPVSATSAPTTTPACEAAYRTCVASCPVLPSYRIKESYQQFSCFASVTSTTSPSATPSLSPTMAFQAPTVAPSVQSVATLAIKQSISGVTLQTANSSSFIAAFKLSTIASLKVDISVDNIVITGIKASNSRRNFLTSGVVISSILLVPNSNVATLASNLNTAISSGAFTAALVSSGYPAASATATAQLVDTTSMPPSAIPTASPTALTARSTLSRSATIGTAVGVVIACCLLCSILYYTCRTKRSVEYTGAGGYGRGSYDDDGHFQNVLDQRNEIVEPIVGANDRQL